MSVSHIQASAPFAVTWGDRPAPRERLAAGDPSETPPSLGREAEDTADFSREALALSRGGQMAVVGSGPEAEREEDTTNGETSGAVDSLTAEERQQVEKLKARDAEVRAHEAAHMAAGGAHVRGGATYSYQQGPDGRQYAVGGEVGIDVSSVAGNPQATIQKMQQVRAAALAPAEPSGADRAVASRAAQIEAQAREELAARNAERVTSAYGSPGQSGTGGLVETTA